MREYMSEYRKKHPEYNEKLKTNYVEKYNSDPEFREKKIEYCKTYNLKRKGLNIEKVEITA